MPTTRPRHLLTESDELRDALQVARRRWPEDADRPTALLLRLIDEGMKRLDGVEQVERERRLDAIARLGSGLEGVYPAGYLEAMREDWPQ